jgi:hypothetical protein
MKKKLYVIAFIATTICFGQHTINVGSLDSHENSLKKQMISLVFKATTAAVHDTIDHDSKWATLFDINQQELLAKDESSSITEQIADVWQAHLESIGIKIFYIIKNNTLQAELNKTFGLDFVQWPEKSFELIEQERLYLADIIDSYIPDSTRKAYSTNQLSQMVLEIATQILHKANINLSRLSPKTTYLEATEHQANKFTEKTLVLLQRLKTNLFAMEKYEKELIKQFQQRLNVEQDPETLVTIKKQLSIHTDYLKHINKQQEQLGNTLILLNWKLWYANARQKTAWKLILVPVEKISKLFFS